MIINIADITDPDDPAGRTYREVNAAKVHALAVGALVETEDGARAFIAAHRRDCDQEPLYSLSLDPADRVGTDHGYGEDGLRLVERET